MPATMYKLTQKFRQPKSTRRTEEVELVTVYLELNSRVQPTWGQSVEPDAYITDFKGRLLVLDDGADREVRVGNVSAHSVHLGEAYEDGVSWFDVLDVRSANTAVNAVLIDSERSCYTEWIESTFEPLVVIF